MTPETKKKYLSPDTIWKRKNRGTWERVYVESLSSRLLRNGAGYVDIRTPFGTEAVPRDKFIALYEFCGWANVRLGEIADDKNLKPFLGDSLKW